MIILKSKHEKIVQDLVNEIADYQKLLYYRAISEQITTGEGVVTIEVLYGIHFDLVPQYYVKCLLWNEEEKFAKTRKVANFSTKYEADELKDLILENETIQYFIGQLKHVAHISYELPTINMELKKQLEEYEDFFCAWTENIEQILNETKVQR